MVGLKPIHGGSTPPFLVSVIVLERMQAVQMCGKVEGSHVVIPRLWRLVLLREPLAWR